MKICASCHKDLPKASYSKKQWKLDEYQRRCKVCVTNNREVQPIPKQEDTNEIFKTLDSVCLKDAEISDEELFKQPPSQYEDCPICFLLLPSLDMGRKYYSCCGKRICNGCSYAVKKTKKTAISLCPFCRAPTHTSEEEANEREKKRMEAGDADAIRNLGVYYRDGKYGFRQDHAKAFKLFVRAAKLGHAGACANIGYAYRNGQGVEVDRKKGEYYYEQAAMRGNNIARYNLGNDEFLTGNMDRAIKHFMIAVRGGDYVSLNAIKELHTKGHATKEDYTKALRAYQEYLGEIKSPQRDTAAAARKNYRYY